MDHRFGHIDLGPTGIAFFFSSHECNSICTALGLTVFEVGRNKHHSEDAREINHIGMRKGNTRPVLTRCLTGRAKPREQLASLIAPEGTNSVLKSEHSLVKLQSEVPMKPSPTSIVHLALAVLHEQGRLALLYEELKAVCDGKTQFSGSEKPPDLEMAFYHFQKSALKGCVEAQMICAQIFSGFEPRDYLPELSLRDEKRAKYYLQLAAQRNHRSAVLHSAEIEFAQEKYAEAAKLFIAGATLSELSENPHPALPFNVWPASTTSTSSLYAKAGECFEKLEKWSDAAEWFGSAAEEAFADPMKAKQAMQYQAQKTLYEAK